MPLTFEGYTDGVTQETPFLHTITMEGFTQPTPNEYLYLKICSDSRSGCHDAMELFQGRRLKVTFDDWAPGGGNLTAEEMARQRNEIEPVEGEPRFRHNCSSCIYLGRDTSDRHRRGVDLYICFRGRVPSLTRRTGNQEDAFSQTTVGLPDILEGRLHPHYKEAAKRAIQRGLFATERAS